MYAPHTVTVYNAETVTDTSDMTDRTVNHITVIRGVFRDASVAGKIRVGGVDGADGVKVFVPFDANARDGITGQTKRFAAPSVFASAPEDEKSSLWTLTTDGKTFIVDGEVVDEAGTAASLSADHTVFSVTRYEVRDFGSPGMRHIEIGGA